MLEKDWDWINSLVLSLYDRMRIFKLFRTYNCIVNLVPELLNLEESSEQEAYALSKLQSLVTNTGLFCFYALASFPFTRLY